jgi:hypothetical protein
MIMRFWLDSLFTIEGWYTTGPPRHIIDEVFQTIFDVDGGRGMIQGCLLRQREIVAIDIEKKTSIVSSFFAMVSGEGTGPPSFAYGDSRKC